MVFRFQIKFNIFMYVQQTGLGNVCHIRAMWITCVESVSAFQ